MQHSSTSIIQTLERSDVDRVKAVQRDIAALDDLLRDLMTQFIARLDARVALFLLSEHISRIHKAIDSLKEKKSSMIDELNLLKSQLEARSRQVQELLDFVKLDNPSKPVPESAPTLLVAGAGPLGCLAALLLHDSSDQHKSNVALVADRHSDYPTRGGSINRDALLAYAIDLGLGERDATVDTYSPRLERLMKFITLRKGSPESIKHFEMLGRAVYLAKGGKIIHGTINWSDIKEEADQRLPTVRVSPDVKDEKTEIKATDIVNVRGIVNAMGTHTTYPEGTQRTPIIDAQGNPLQILRSQCSQVNVTLSNELFVKLHDLIDAYPRNRCMMPFISYGYMFSFVDEFEHDFKPEKGILYIKKEESGVRYRVITPDGKIANKFIPHDQIDTTKASFEIQVLRIAAENKDVHYGKDGRFKAQIYSCLTRKESLLLNRLVDALFPEQEGLSAKKIKENKIVLKMQLLLEFLAERKGINISADLSKMFLRDQIKPGKTLCSDFEIPAPDAPPLAVTAIPKTHAFTACVGAAALPAALTGRFVTDATAQAKVLLQHLIKSDFQLGDLTSTKVGKAYNAYIEELKEYAQDQRDESPDMSDEMLGYFQRKLGDKMPHVDELQKELKKGVSVEGENVSLLTKQKSL